MQTGIAHIWLAVVVKPKGAVGERSAQVKLCRAIDGDVNAGCGEFDLEAVGAVGVPAGGAEGAGAGQFADALSIRISKKLRNKP